MEKVRKEKPESLRGLRRMALKRIPTCTCTLGLPGLASPLRTGFLLSKKTTRCWLGTLHGQRGKTWRSPQGWMATREEPSIGSQSYNQEVGCGIPGWHPSAEEWSLPSGHPPPERLGGTSRTLARARWTQIPCFCWSLSSCEKSQKKTTKLASNPTGSHNAVVWNLNKAFKNLIQVPNLGSSRCVRMTLAHRNQSFKACLQKQTLNQKSLRTAEEKAGCHGKNMERNNVGSTAQEGENRMKCQHIQNVKKMLEGFNFRGCYLWRKEYFLGANCISCLPEVVNHRTCFWSSFSSLWLESKYSMPLFKRLSLNMNWQVLSCLDARW